MTNTLAEGKEDEIISIISSSRESMKSAIDIEKSLRSCRINMIKKVLEAIEQRLDVKFENSNKLEMNSYKENNYKRVNTYYDKKGSTYPGMGYHIKSLDKEGIDLILRFEIDNSLFVGLCTSYNKEYNGKQLDKKEIDILLNEHEPCTNGRWIYWEYLPSNNQSTSPNFKDFNEAYLDLLDENKFKNFIEECVDKILEIKNMVK